MKLSSSPSISSSSSTVFNGIFPNTKTSISGFLSFLLRRILCSTNLPTHPSDHLQEINPIEYQNPHFMNPKKPDDSATPNLVAKLMGLDSMPETNEQKNFPSITRSKSMNSGDCKVEETEEVQRKQHRRAKSSVSFRETQSYFELEDDDFFVISFDNGGTNGKPRSKREKAEMGGREKEQRRRRRNRGGGEKEQRPRFKFEESNSESLVLEIENSNQAKTRIRKKNKEKFLEGVKFETESGSENSSPVSVLDHSLFINDHEVPKSEKVPKNRNSSSRRKLASDLSNRKHSTSNNETYPKENDLNPIESSKGKQTGLRRKGSRRRQKRGMLNKKISSLAKSDIAELEWMCNGGLIRDFKNWEDEIGVELSLQIVDKLVDEIVHQLI